MARTPMASTERFGEDVLIDWLRRRTPEGLIGDDGAVLPASNTLAVTVDSQIESVHFVPDLDPALVAKRLLAVNLSDLAAMGAHPAYGFLALAAPPDFDHRRFLRALLQASTPLGLALAGGDLASSTVISASLTLIGRRTGRHWLRRAAAHPGDRLWLGGTIGESAAGCELVARGARLHGRRIDLPELTAAGSDKIPRSLLMAAKRAVRRHLLPKPQLELGAWLSEQTRAAAIDVSDGLARDLHRLCRESNVGAEIDLESLPFAPHFAELAEQLDRDPQSFALGGGEDYILLFTLPDGLLPPSSFGCQPIGTILPTCEVRGLRDGRSTRLPPSGWDHLK